MPKRLLDFAGEHGLPFSHEQAEKLAAYANLVWQKKDFLNLTSASDLNEVFLRHLCDGLAGATKIQAMAKVAGLDTFTVADAGSGAGYIGMTLAIALPQAKITLIESLERRCSFMNWAVLQLGLKNVKIKNTRLGQHASLSFDFVTERAMGQLPDILGCCLSVLKPGGIFMAYQGEHPQAEQTDPAKWGAVLLGVEKYLLPCDDKKRHFALFRKRV